MKTRDDRMWTFLNCSMVSLALLCYDDASILANAFAPGLQISTSHLPDRSSRSFTSTSMVTSNSADPSTSLPTISQRILQVQVPKPLGIILEEISADAEDRGGVQILQIDPNGNAVKSLPSGSLCVHDKLQAVNGEDVSHADFDTVMQLLINADPVVELTLLRPKGSVVVQWTNGVCVAAQPGEYLGNVAMEAGMKISYSCRSGSCGTCEQSVSIDNGKEQRYCRPCSFRIPRGGVHSMAVTPSDRMVSF